MRVLNDEEMKVLRPDVPMCQQTVFDCSGCSAQCGLIAKAQHEKDLKDLIEWGNEECFEHPYSSRAKGEAYNRKRHRCPECWESLKRLVEKDGNES
uniref:Uncharacterized protein n=1 Tax=viral metagenome TaxID=1070528 RepID=A0A6M3INN8_9ZZZZ